MPADKPAATEHGTGSGKPLCKGPVDSDGYHCICSNYHEHNGKCRHHNQVFHNMPTPPASQPTVETLQLLLEQSQKENALLYEELTQLKARVKELMNHLSSSGT